MIWVGGWGVGMFSILVGRDFCACVEVVFRRKITESNIQRGWVGRVWGGGGTDYHNNI